MTLEILVLGVTQIVSALAAVQWSISAVEYIEGGSSNHQYYYAC